MRESDRYKTLTSRQVPLRNWTPKPSGITYFVRLGSVDLTTWRSAALLHQALAALAFYFRSCGEEALRQIASLSRHFAGRRKQVRIVIPIARYQRRGAR